jgi:serine/threonine protein kinase
MHPDKIIQNYRLVSFLGDGGMGQVWLAEHTLLGRKVAIKSLHPQFARNEGIRARFKQEAATLSHLQHPGIVGMHDYIEDGDGAYLVMEYVDGMPLDDYIQRHSGPIPTPQLRGLFGQILDGFSYAHAQMIVHRDIKPSNFLVTKGGIVKILDFGIAKILTDGERKLTKTGTHLGTVLYMSPEQVRGEILDQRSDIYALGVTLFQMATGQCPYASDTSEFHVYDQIVNHPLPAAASRYPGVTPDIEALIQKATQKQPSHRFQTCIEFKNALMAEEKEVTPPKPKELAQTVVDVQAMPPAQPPAPVPAQVQNQPPAAPPTPKKKGFPIWAVAGTLIALALVAVLLVVSLGGIGSNDNSQTSASETSQAPVRSPKETVQAFYDYLGTQQYREAYDLTDNPSWPTYSGFSSRSKGFGCVDGSNVSYVEEQQNDGHTATVEAEAYMSDPCNGSHTYRFKYTLKMLGNQWKITGSKCLNC